MLEHEGRSVMAEDPSICQHVTLEHTLHLYHLEHYRNSITQGEIKSWYKIESNSIYTIQNKLYLTKYIQLQQLSAAYRNIPSVCGPLSLRTVSVSMTTTQGIFKCGFVSSCISITSSTVVPNIDGLNGASYSEISWALGSREWHNIRVKQYGLMLFCVLCLSVRWSMYTLACWISSRDGFFSPFLAPIIVIFSTLLWQYSAYTCTGTCTNI